MQWASTVVSSSFVYPRPCLYQALHHFLSMVKNNKMRVFENMVTLNPKCLIITIPLKIAVLHLICGPLPCLSPHENCHLTDIPIYPMFRYTLGQSGEKKTGPEPMVPPRWKQKRHQKNANKSADAKGPNEKIDHRTIFSKMRRKPTVWMQNLVPFTMGTTV